MYLPNYEDGSLVNLMSSIQHALGGRSAYQPLACLPPETLQQSQKIVLLVLDGLGYNYLVDRGWDSFLYRHLEDKITSVFPSTTAACVTTFATGVAPQQHAVTGWFMNFKELGTVSAILPGQPRFSTHALDHVNVKPRRLLDHPSFFGKIEARSYGVLPKKLIKSPYNRATMRGAKLKGYKNLRQCFKRIRKILHKKPRPRYVYAYWPEFDRLSHEYGNASETVWQHFRRLDEAVAEFAESVRGTDTTLLVTADHGFVDAEQTIDLRHHPRLKATLTLPLCGEQRSAYCYVRPSRVADFEAYVQQELADACHLCRGPELIEQNYFGLFQPHYKLFDRVGDYVLLMKDKYIIKDRVFGERGNHHLGYHGGVSGAEMHVPLVRVQL